MKLKVSISFVVIAVFAIASWFVWQRGQAPNSISSAIPTTSQTTSTVTDIDFSKLEKDRLYTEEEGSYSNLPAVGKRVLWAALAPQCIANPDGNHCGDWKQTIVNSSIVAVNNSILLMEIPSGKGSSGYLLYDLKQKKQLGDTLSYFGTKIRNDMFIVYINNMPDKTQELLYYRPGMTAFAPVQGSDIPSAESYWYYGGMGSLISEAMFTGNVLNIVLFTEWKGEIGLTVPKKIKTAMFDLSLSQ